MFKAVHFDGKKLMIDKNYLRKHDVKYFSPNYKGYNGLPMGDGDTTYMLWNTKSDIVLHINKSDAVDFSEDGRFKAWSWESEEKNTSQVHCGRIIISDSMPSFDNLYLKSFKENLNINDGCSTLESKTQFSEWNCSFSASHAKKVMIAKISANSEEPVERAVKLEAWGSRNFYHFYEQFSDDTAKGLEDTVSGEKDGCIYVTRSLKNVSVSTCLKIVGAESKVVVDNSHTVKFILPKSKTANFTVISATKVSTKNDENSVQMAIDQINNAALSVDSILCEEKENWHDFWQKSFVHLEDDYLENLYYINLYSLNCCSLGKYPVNSLGGAWTWNRDIRNWGHFYHWNCQQTFWGNDEANHPELSENYYNYRFNMLKNAKKDAKDVFNANGAFFSDISNYNGFQAIEPDTKRNLTVGPQIAMDFYRHYKYINDEKFLREKAYPVMKECVLFYCSMLKIENDGKYHISGGATAYESFWNFKDSITDYCMINVLFNSFVEASQKLGLEIENADLINDILSNLYEMPKTECKIENGENTEMIAAGVKWNGKSASINEGDYPLSPFPACQICALFPSGLISLKDKGTDIFKTTEKTVRFIIETEFFKQGKMGCSGHTPIPQAAARLGMKDLTLPILRAFAERFQRFSNGFMHYLGREVGDFENEAYRSRILEKATKSTDWENVHEKSDGRRVTFNGDDFVNMYYESSSNFMCGINEMLLQSFDGVIRVFPAASLDYSASFKLSAEGGFIVTSEMMNGEVRFIAIKSENGGKCTVEIPWSPSILIKEENNEVEFNSNNNQVDFETSAGKTYIIERRERPISMYYVSPFCGEIENDVKKLGKAVLGRQKDF